MTASAFAPGTFWDISGRRYVIDPAHHWVRIDEPVLFRIPPMAPDTAGAVQLRLVPVAEASTLLPIRRYAEALAVTGRATGDRDKERAALDMLALIEKAEGESRG